MTAFIDPGLSVAMLDQMVVATDRRAEALLQNLARMAAPDAGSFGLIPALSWPGVCVRSVHLTVPGNGETPRVVSHSSRDCAPMPGRAAAATLLNAPGRHQAPNVVEAKASAPYQGLVRTVGDRQH